MTDTITLTGLVATTPRATTTHDGLAVTSFRLASNQRYFDKRTQSWVSGDTNWYTISAFRQLASNAAVSVAKGDRVIVTGRLKIRQWETGEKQGTTVEVEADSIGHDLSWGTSEYHRTISRDTERPDSADHGGQLSSLPEREEWPATAAVTAVVSPVAVGALAPPF